MNLDIQSRQAFTAYLKAIVAHTIKGGAQAFAPLPDAAAGWPIDDKVYDQFIDLVVNKSAFLGRVDMARGLDTLVGNILRDNLPEFILKRTNVDDTVRRKPTITGTATPEGYQLRMTEWDYVITYERIRQWAKKGPNFLSGRIADQAARTFANNIQWVGFRGTSDGNPPAAADLTDFQIGWLQLLRAFSAGARFMDEVVAGSSRITVGPQRVLTFTGAAVNVGGGVVGLPCTAHGRPSGSQIVIAGTVNYNGAFLVLASSTANQINITAAYVAEDLTGKTATHQPDYASLDALAADLRNAIEPELRDGLVAVVAENLRATEEETIYGEVGRTPTEKLALQRAFAELAGLERVSPYGLPDGTILITPPMNLAVYWHQEMHRRIEDTPEVNGVTFWNDTHLDFVLTDYRRAFAAENIAITK